MSHCSEPLITLSNELNNFSDGIFFFLAVANILTVTDNLYRNFGSKRRTNYIQLKEEENIVLNAVPGANNTQTIANKKK